MPDRFATCLLFIHIVGIYLLLLLIPSPYMLNGILHTASLQVNLVVHGNVFYVVRFHVVMYVCKSATLRENAFLCL